MTKISFNLCCTLLCYRPSSRYSSQSSSSCICNAPFFFHFIRERGLGKAIYFLFAICLLMQLSWEKFLTFLPNNGDFPEVSHLLLQVTQQHPGSHGIGGFGESQADLRLCPPVLPGKTGGRCFRTCFIELPAFPWPGRPWR